MGSSEVDGADTGRYAVWWNPTYDLLFSLAPRTTMSDILFPFLLSSFHRHAFALGVQKWVRNPYGTVPHRGRPWDICPCNSRLDGNEKLPTIVLRRRRECPSMSNRGAIRTVRHRLYHACVNIENDLVGDFYREETIGKKMRKLILNKQRALTVEELPCERRGEGSRVRRHPRSWVPGGQVTLRTEKPG